MLILKMNMPLILMSLYGGVMILAVLLLKKSFGRFLPKRLFPILWILVMIRLTVPFSVSSPYNLISLPDHSFFYSGQSYNTAVESGTVSDIATTESQLGTAQTAANLSEESYSLPASLRLPEINVIWAGGALILALVLLIKYHRASRKFEDSILIEQDTRVTAVLEQTHVRTEIYLCDQIQGPLVSGIFRPLIFLPAALDFCDETLLRNILLHECAHIRRQDNLMKALMIAVLILHWFNPVVWLMVRSFSRDLEEACDETVITKMNLDQRQAYARSLVQMSRRRLKASWSYCAFSRNEVERRVRSIAVYRPLRKAAVIVCGCLFLMFTTLSAAAAQTSFASELSSYCSSNESRFILKADLHRELGLSSSSQIRSRADQALISVLKQNPDAGMAELRVKAAAALADEFQVEPQAFEITAGLNLDEHQLEEEYRSHDLIYENDRYTRNGRPVRIMEDKLAGRYSLTDTGEVDVYIERDDHGYITELRTYHVK